MNTEETTIDETKTEEMQPEKMEMDLGISEQADNAITFLENGDLQAFKSVNNYFSLLIGKLNAFDITDISVTYDQVFEKINQLLPLRDEVIKVIISIAKFEEHPRFYQELHSFFENLLPYFKFRNEGDSRNPLAADHYESFGTELFLYAVAASLKYRRFEQLNELTHQGYYVPQSKNGRADEFIAFTRFNYFPEALTGYYKSKGIRQEIQKSNYFKTKMTESEITYEDLAQADFVLYLISLLDSRQSGEFFFNIWGNRIYSENYPLELFVRSESLWFFQRFAKCLREISKDDINQLISAYNEKVSKSGLYSRSLVLEDKIALSKIATRP
jgi:hypothetical protein